LLKFHDPCPIRTLELLTTHSAITNGKLSFTGYKD
jgi:hypothetical protein